MARALAKPNVKEGGGRQIKPDVVAYKRARILEEASALFFDRGYDIATLDMLADRLHVTKPFLYTYFRNKSDILAAVCAVGVTESLDALEVVEHAPGSPAEHLRAALEQVARIIIKRSDYIMVYQREIMNLERGDAQHILRLRHEFDIRVARLIEDCQRAGQVTLPDAQAMSVWMGGLLVWIPNCYRPGSRRSAEEIVDQVVQACLRLVGLK
ncbi:TetR/AcrR family transcriptional regulator [Sphingomonas sp. LHG3406-1]|uniref:TetR/AcrR family transcriptional regulator n=1 Tax=Sphingomonas sp. LHG3406-1 TaxID=2804617 RepID=UPI002605FCD0|nr:TetR/AcrR family transcriptional regulator [Sphingomonas sp. LHG3406-1]